MKALSLRQPWASLVGPKRHETRSWPTSYRGPVVIHASKSFGPEEQAICLTTPFRELLTKMGLMTFDTLDLLRPTFHLPLGALISTCWLTDCVSTEICEIGGDHFVDAIDRLLGDYDPKRFAFELGMFKKLKEPIPYKGRLGFFEVPDALFIDHLGPLVNYSSLNSEIKRAMKGQ